MGARTFHKWTSAETLQLIENYDSLTNAELARLIGVSRNSIKRKGYDLKLKKSDATLSKIQKRPNGGQFKKGAAPGNTLTDGAITTRLDQRGRIIRYIRVGLNKWIELQHYNWQQAGFERPPGMVLSFKDGDSTNCDVSNLELITKAQNLARNRPAPEKRPEIQAKIVASRKSASAKAAIRKENKRANKKRQLEVRRQLKAESKAALIREAREAKKAELEKLRLLIIEERANNKPVRVNRVRSLSDDQVRFKLEAAELKAKLKLEAEKQKAADNIFRAEQRRMAKAKKERERLNNEAEENKKLPTRQVDYSQLIQLRIDHKTVIYVKPGTDIEKIKAKYAKPVHDPYANLPPVYEF